MKKQARLYNLIFPLFFLVLFPPFWIAILPANFIIDFIVVYFTMKYLKILNPLDKVKSVIFKVWIFGFLADIIGSVAIVNMARMDKILKIDSDYWYKNVYNNVAYSPTKNIYAFLIILVGLIITALCIYFFNYKISLKKLDVTELEKKKIALSVAIFTTPYIYFMNSPFF